jgi:hypothetical protein
MNAGREPYESDAVEIGFMVGSISNKFSPYDGLTDEEADELKRDLDERLSRRIPAGFAPSKRKRMKIGGRRPGSWPKIGWFT